VIARWGSNPAEHWAYSKTKTRSKLMMPKVCVYWRFIWAGVRHEVELFHSTVSGKRTIRCDGALVAQEKLFIDTGSRHDFTIGTGTRPCQITVLICASGSEFAYELFVNKVRFYQALQGQTHTDRHTARALHVRAQSRSFIVAAPSPLPFLCFSFFACSFQPG